MLTEMHAHVLYGLDDGAGTKEDMRRMLEMAKANGIGRLYCTPHFAPGRRRFEVQQMEERLQEAREMTGIGLFSGGEIYYHDDTLRLLKAGQAPSYDGTRAVLIEFSPREKLRYVQEAASALTRDGWRVVLAHAERMDCLARRGALETLKENREVYAQVNSESLFNEQTGFFFRRRMRRWVGEGLIDFVSSDAHNLESRPFCLKYAHRWLKMNFDGDTADRLCGDNFEKLIADSRR